MFSSCLSIGGHNFHWRPSLGTPSRDGEMVRKMIENVFYSGLKTNIGSKSFDDMPNHRIWMSFFSKRCIG